MIDWFNSWFTNVSTEYLWIFQIFIIVLMTLIVHAIVNSVFKKLSAKAHATHNVWDETIIDAMHLPLGTLIWLLGISLASQVAGAQTHGVGLFSSVPMLRKLGIIIIITWFCLRFVKKLESNLIARAEKQHKEVDKTLIHALSQLVTISIIITAVLVGMQLFGLPISGLLAFGGIGGAGVAFASKDLLANFFGGLVIYMDRPFKVGDWIRSPDKNIEGTVEHIGWRVTRIRTFDKRPLYVPNGVFLTISVENPSRMTNRRIKTLIGVRYDDAHKLAAIIEDVERMLRQHPEIDTTQTLIVNLVEFASSSLNFMIYTFTKTTNWVKFQAVQQDVFLKVIEIVEKHGAQCAFPTQTLHIPEGLVISNKGV